MSPLGVSISWDAGTHHEEMGYARWSKMEKAGGWQCLMVLATRAPGRCVTMFPLIRTTRYLLDSLKNPLFHSYSVKR